MKRIRIFGHCGISKEDPEKAVLPTIIYVNPNHKSFKYGEPGLALSIGWWHYYIYIAFVIVSKTGKA